MATQLNDMSLGGSGFAAGYTPIRFAPLVSLTGPIQGATPPAAPEAPMARPPMLPMNQIGGYEGMGPAFTGDAIGEASRMGSPAGRQAELANLVNAAGFLANPAMLAAYALTGQSPAQMFGVGDFRAAQGAPQRGLMPEGGLSGIFGNLSNWFSRNVFGPEQYPLYETRAPLETATPISSHIIDISAALGITPEQVMAIMGAQPAPDFGPVSTLGMDMFGPQGTPAIAPQALSRDAMAQAAADAIAVNPIGGGGQIGSYDFGGSGETGRSEGFGISDFSGGGQAPY